MQYTNKSNWTNKRENTNKPTDIPVHLMSNIENFKLMFKCKNTSTYSLDIQIHVLNTFISKTNTSNPCVCYKQKQNADK